MKTCPLCGCTDVITFDADNDLCKNCGKWFPAVEDVPTVYCHACSVAGGAECAIYHLPPVCDVGADQEIGSGGRIDDNDPNDISA